VGADESFSQTLITLRFLDQLLEILRIARDTGADAMATGRAYYALSDTLDVPWLRGMAFASDRDGPWERRAARALTQDLSRVHRRLVVSAVKESAGGDVAKAAAAMLEAAGAELERYRGVVAEMKGEALGGIAGASVALRELGALADRLAR